MIGLLGLLGSYPGTCSLKNLRRVGHHEGDIILWCVRGTRDTRSANSLARVWVPAAVALVNADQVDKLGVVVLPDFSFGPHILLAVRVSDCHVPESCGSTT
jgi:hypothetical protein